MAGKAQDTAGEWGAVAIPRIPIAQLPTVVEAIVTRDQGEGTRDRFVWQIDGYGAIVVMVYLTRGMEFPAEGYSFTLADFDASLGTDKPRRGTKVGVVPFGGTDPTTGKALCMVSMEAPAKGYKLERLNISLAAS
jgi:hypothetical protein